MGHCIGVRFVADSIISSLGFGTAKNIDAITSGRLGVALDGSREVSDNNIMAGRIPGERLKQYAAEFGIESCSRFEQLIILSIKDILSKSGLDISKESCAIIISTTKGEITSIAAGGESVPLWQTAANIADFFGIPTEDVSVISNACISGVSAIVTAGRLIGEKHYENVIVVGVDMLSRFITSGFLSFRSLSEDACLPYDLRRCGLNLGEACGAVLLTGKTIGEISGGIFDKAEDGAQLPDSEYMCREEKEIYLLGGAISNDANHISGPSRTGDGLYLAMAGAIEEAGLDFSAIDAVNLHGTATVFNDEMESKAMQLARLEDVPSNSLKPYFGHTMGASGVIETIVALYQLRLETVFATPGYKENGVPVALNTSGEHRPFPAMNNILKTASGFGGCNAAIVISSASRGSLIERKPCTPAREGDHSDKNSSSTEERGRYLKIDRHCLIEDEKIILDGEEVFHSSGSGDFHLFIREAFKYSEDGNMKFYKMDNLCKLGYVAASLLLKEEEPSAGNTAIVISNSSSSLDTDLKHQKNIEDGGDSGASPAIFVYTLPNIVAGEICIKYGIKGENTFFVTKEFSPELLERHILSIAKYTGAIRFIYGWCEYSENNYKADIRYGTVN